MYREERVYHTSLLCAFILHVAVLVILGRIYSFDVRNVLKPVKISYVFIKKAAEPEKIREVVKPVEKVNIPAMPKEVKPRQVVQKDNVDGIIKKPKPAAKKIKSVRTAPRKKIDPVKNLLQSIAVNDYLKTDERRTVFNAEPLKKQDVQVPVESELAVKKESHYDFTQENIIRKKNAAEIQPGRPVGKETGDSRSPRAEQHTVDLVFKEDRIDFNKDLPIMLTPVEVTGSNDKERTADVPKLLKSPNIPAPEWFEKKGISTEIMLQGVINGDGYLKEVEIIKTSGYYKLDILTRRFVRKHWQWEPGKADARVTIRLFAEFRK